jgi:hypothetical protein
LSGPAKSDPAVRDMVGHAVGQSWGALGSGRARPFGGGAGGAVCCGQSLCSA